MVVHPTSPSPVWSGRRWAVSLAHMTDLAQFSQRPARLPLRLATAKVSMMAAFTAALGMPWGTTTKMSSRYAHGQMLGRASSVLRMSEAPITKNSSPRMQPWQTPASERREASKPASLKAGGRTRREFSQYAHSYRHTRPGAWLTTWRAVWTQLMELKVLHQSNETRAHSCPLSFILWMAWMGTSTLPGKAMLYWCQPT